MPQPGTNQCAFQEQKIYTFHLLSFKTANKKQTAFLKQN